MAGGRSAAGERTQTNGQARALILTGPDDLRARFAKHTAAPLVTAIASLRPRPGEAAGYATRIALRELGRRVVLPGASSSAPANSSSLSSPPAPPGSWPSTVPGPAPRRCCSSQRETTPGGCAARPPGRTCAPPPSRHRRESHPPPAQPRR
jgi:hypothetical protein